MSVGGGSGGGEQLGGPEGGAESHLPADQQKLQGGGDAGSRSVKCVGVREGEERRQRGQREQTCSGPEREGPWGGQQAAPAHGYLGSQAGEGDLPTPWLSHSHCVPLGMEKCIDLCWFCVTFDLSHN